MESTISIRNTEASMPVLFQLKDSTTILLVNSNGSGTCVYVDEEKDTKIQIGDIMLSFCKPNSLMEDIEPRLGKVLPVGTQIALRQS